MAMMTADEASLIPESKLRPWVNHAILDKQSNAEADKLELALVLCTPYKIGPFQSEIDKPVDMTATRLKHGMGPLPDRDELIKEYGPVHTCTELRGKRGTNSTSLQLAQVHEGQGGDNGQAAGRRVL
jgi:hypothetical protein